MDSRGSVASHLVAQYEAESEAKEGVEHTSHNEQTEGAQMVFMENADKLFQVMTDMTEYGQSFSGRE